VILREKLLVTDGPDTREVVPEDLHGVWRVMSRTGMALRTVAVLAVALLGGCINLRLPNLLPDALTARPVTTSSTPVGAPAGTSLPGSQATAPSTAGRPDDSSLKPFADVIAGASRSDGYFTVWQKYDRVWIEIPADRLDRPFFFSYNVSDSVGERRVYASQMGKPYVVVFHRVGNAMQLIARNTRFVAAAGSPAERAVRESFTDSLLASAPVLSRPHPQRGSVVVDATALLLTDIPGYSTTLESAFHINYALDRANSSFVVARTNAGGTSFSVRTHFSTARLPIAGAPGMPSPPTTPPDARSVFVGFVYNFAPLPEPMRPRLADDRVGFETTVVADYTSDAERTPRRYFVERWRLEKRDPDAALSEPKRPITFWIDRNVPLAYRATVEEGILAWNAAFERIGFRNAIVVRIQPDDADFDTLDAQHASVRWYFGRDAGYAIGPTHTDPRTGEILDAVVAIPDAFTRGARSVVTESFPPTSLATGGGLDATARCAYAEEAVGEAAFALGLLDARGTVPIDGARADRFARDYLRAVVTHEVGHALGLRHNFRGSTIRTAGQLQDAAFTEAHGLSGSVMDYAPFNIAMQGERQGEYVMSGLGPYDYWAIEYAYKPIVAADADGERPELARIASRSAEPDLAYASDEDAGSSGDAVDPEINRFDLGNDPLAYYRKRFALSRELWARLQSRPMRPDESYLVLRRNLERGFEEIAYAAPLIAKYVGGVRTSRNHASTTTDVLFAPVDAARQRAALDLLAGQIFAVDSFRFDPAFLARLGVDYLDRGEPGAEYGSTFYLPGRVLAIQTTVLDQLMSDSVARRIGNAGNLSNRPEALLSLAQLYDTLQRSIWDELRTGQAITPMRRNLQREHLRRLVGTLLRTSAPSLADARSLQRENALALRAAMGRALMAKRLSIEDRAHLREGVATLDEALRAHLTRSGV